MKTLNTICIVIIWVLAFKTILGFHFPWEQCQCCGKKWKHHKKSLLYIFNKSYEK